MNTLENYNRDDKYIRSLNLAFDKYLELDETSIVTILDNIDLFDIDEVELPEISWKEIYKSKKNEQIDKLKNRFSFELSRNHNQYKRILKRFIEEHLKFPNAITFVLKNQLRYTKETLRRLEIEYFSEPKNNHDKFIFSLKDIASDLLDNLIDDLKIEYMDYLKYSNIGEMPILDIEEDEFEFNKVPSKVVLMNELGIIEAIGNNTKGMNNTKLAIILSKITGLKSETLKRSILDMNKAHKNDPYVSDKNLNKVKALFTFHKIIKKGE